MTNLDQALQIIRTTRGNPIDIYKAMLPADRILINQEARRLGVYTEEYLEGLKK